MTIFRSIFDDMIKKLFLYRIVVTLVVIVVNSNICRAESNYPFYSNYDINFYLLNLEVSSASTALFGKVDIQAVWKGATSDTLKVELIEYGIVDSIIVNGAIAEIQREGDLILIFPKNALETGLGFSTSIYYHLPENDQSGSKGIFSKKGFNGKLVTYTLSEPYYSKSWFPCKQDLLDKIDSVYFYLTIGDSLLAGSNGVLKRVVPLGGGKKRMEWESNIPMAYYLISFAVADYMEYNFMASTADGDSVFVQNYIYNDSAFLESNRDDIDATADLIELFSMKMGVYPFKSEKYGHCIAPLGGGMEHQTMTTLGSFNFRLVAHELAHQWYGDNVTCANWQDIWVNEGFASYGEYIALEGLQPGKEKEWLNGTHEYALSKPEGSIYVPKEDLTDVSRIFEYALTYRKGAAIIHMIRHEIGNDELFFDLLADFQNQYGDSVATGDDFRVLAETYAGRDLNFFFDQWYYGEGFPTLSFKWEQRNDTLLIYVNQTTSAPQVTEIFNLLIDFKVSFLGGDTLVQFRQDMLVDTFQLPINNRVYQISPDPEEWLVRIIEGNYRILPDNSNKMFNVFPNPSGGEVYIENYSVGTPYTFELYNSSGNLVETGESTEAFFYLDLSKNASGVYPLVLTASGTKQTIKLSIL